MKKVLIASGIAVMAFAMIAGAAGYAFNTNLTVGSTGPDVVALQSALMAAGFNIPAIASGAATPGYFGSQTKTAVAAYQVAKGIVNPGTGFVGPLTRAALNGSAVAGTPPTVTCPVGYICTPQGGTVPPVTTTPGVITTPGVAGTLALTLQGSPSGATLDKGESEDIARYKLQASASDMQVTSLALDFDVRLWLYASSITVKDDAGTVIASKSGLTQGDFTELTVGSSYRLYVPVNYVVPKAMSKYFTVNVTMLPASDRCTTTCTLTITSAQVRSVDGTGVTDTQTDGSDRTFSFTGTNSGQIVMTVNASSPLKKLVQISNSNETTGVVLGVVDLKSQNKDATLRTLKVYVNTDATGVNTLFSRIKIKAGSQEYTANTVDVASPNTAASSTVTFTDLTIPLPKDVYVPITILVDVAKPSTTGALDGKTASTTVMANATNIVAEDTTFNNVTVNAGTVVSSDQVFSASSAVVSNMVAKLGTGIQSSNTTVKYPIEEMSFTLSAGDNTLYVSATPGIALSTTSSQSAGLGTTSLTDVTVTPGSLSGDTSTYFVVPAGGSRNFKYAGLSDNTAIGSYVPSGLKTFKITGIKYGTASNALTANTIDYNLDALKVTPTF